MRNQEVAGDAAGLNDKTKALIRLLKSPKKTALREALAEYNTRALDQEGMFGDPDVLPGSTLKGLADDLVGPVKEGSHAAEDGGDVVMADRETVGEPDRVPVESGARFAGTTPLKRGLYAHLDPKASQKALTDLAVKAQSNTSDYVGVVYRQISETEAKAYAAKGAPIRPGFLQVANVNDIRHAIKQHGSAATETPRGQLPLTTADFASIPDIAKPENMVGVKRMKDGRFSILYQKSQDGHVLLTELVGEKGGQMTFKTMRKKRRHGKHLLASLTQGQIWTLMAEASGKPNRL